MSAGNASSYHGFFDRDLIPKALKLVFAAWERLAWSDRSELEPQITRALAVVLRRLKQARGLPFSVFCEIDPLTEPASRLDFYLLAGPDERAYFTVEAKRLYIPRESGTDANLDEYRKTGIMAFIEGAYAPNLPDGAMLGYVMDGDLKRAISEVKRMLEDENHRENLNISTGPKASRYLPKHTHVVETTHKRHANVQGRKLVVLQHLLVAVG